MGWLDDAVSEAPADRDRRHSHRDIDDASGQGIDHARQIGTDHGRDAASWVFDGNTDRETYETFRRGIEDGDPEIMDRIPSADLSGQWADGYTVADLMADCCGGNTDDPDEIIAAYEEAFVDAATAEVERMISAQLDDHEGHPPTWPNYIDNRGE